MDNFIKAFTISVLMSGSFMTQAMDDLEAEAKTWGFRSVAEYLDQMSQEQQFSKPKSAPDGDPDLEATERLIRQLTGQESEQVLSDALLAKMLQNDGRGGVPYYNEKGGDPYLEASLKLAYQFHEEIDPRGAYNLPYLLLRPANSTH